MSRRRINIASLLPTVCLSFALFAVSAVLHAQTPQEIARKAFGSVVLLVMEDDSGQPVSLGSGFFIRQGVIASNLHVVEGASRGYAKLIGQKAKYDIEGTVGIDPLHDLVLLEISILHTTAPPDSIVEYVLKKRLSRITPLPLRNSEAVEVGEPVYVVGNPQGLEGTFSQGIVSSIREVGTEKLLQITAPISPGSSGGPVLNSRGQVIGVAVATFKGGQNLNFAIPSNYLKALLGKAGPAKPLHEAKSSAGQQSILGDLGGRSTEGVVGGQLLWGFVGNYSFSLRNELHNNVKDIVCLVIFYDTQHMPIEFDLVQYRGTIPAGLSKRVNGEVDGSVRTLTGGAVDEPSRTRIEFRVLDFQIVD
ncbi:MAG: serine protease [Deltaproteobacteria bacterium]|nr:serine protease [Deltaproteobacteria bacterium]